MKLKNLFVSFLAVATLFATGCNKEEIVSTLDGFKAESTYAIVPEGIPSSTYTFTTDQPWSITVPEKEAEWLSVSPTSGSAGTSTVTISVTEAESTREGDFYIVMGGKTQTVHVKQVAADVEPEILTVTEAVSRIKAGTQGDKIVYVKGIVCRITEISPSYGNATYYLSDDGTYGSDNWLQVYRGKWIDGANYTRGDEFALGDEMVISAVLIYYNNVTPETSQGTCSVVSVKKSLLSVDPTEIKVDAAGGTEDVKIVVKDGKLKFSSAADWLSVAGMDAVGDTTVVHVKVAENTAYEKRSGDITFSAETASDVSSVTVTVTQAAAVDPAAAAVYAKATEIISGRTYVIAAGNNMAQNVPADKNFGYLKKEEDDVTVTELGTINSEHPRCEFVITAVEGGYTIRQADGRYLYQSGTYNNFNVSAEPASGHVWSISIDESTGAATITNNSVNKFVQWDPAYGSYGSYDSAKGELPTLYLKNDLSDGTVDNPYTVAKAIEVIEAGDATTDNVYVKGIINKIDNVNLEYGNAQFWISDDGTTAAFELYRSFWFGGEKYTSEDQIKVGDEVVMCGVLTKFNTTYEMKEKNFLYSLNGATE